MRTTLVQRPSTRAWTRPSCSTLSMSCARSGPRTLCPPVLLLLLRALSEVLCAVLVLAPPPTSALLHLQLPVDPALS